MSGQLPCHLPKGGSHNVGRLAGFPPAPISRSKAADGGRYDPAGLLVLVYGSAAFCPETGFRTTSSWAFSSRQPATAYPTVRGV